jgi:hypothetical protein
MSATNLDKVREEALRRIDRAELHYKLGIGALVLVEGAFMVTYLVLMDFGNRLHWLLLVAAMLIYCTLLVGIINVGQYVRSSTQGILRAIESLRGEE